MTDARLCPRCNYVRRDQDSETLPGVCPACGIAYAKWSARQVVAADGVDEFAEPDTDELPLTLAERFRYQFLYMQSDRDESVFWAHILIFIVFTAWGWWLVFNGLDFSVVGASFLHVVNGPFHQYGHIVFSPFGETVTLLGGSLFQLAVPLAACVYFSVLRHDNFPASVMLWWMGENFLDIAPYVADAGDYILPIPESMAGQHDWGALLGNAPEAGDTLAQLVYLCGVLIILLSNYWGFVLLRTEFRGRTSPLAEE